MVSHDKDVFEQFRNKKRDWRWNGMTIIHVSASTVVFVSKTRLLDLWWKDAGLYVDKLYKWHITGFLLHVDRRVNSQVGIGSREYDFDGVI